MSEEPYESTYLFKDDIARIALFIIQLYLPVLLCALVCLFSII